MLFIPILQTKPLRHREPRKSRAGPEPDLWASEPTRPSTTPTTSAAGCAKPHLLAPAGVDSRREQTQSGRLANHGYSRPRRPLSRHSSLCAPNLSSLGGGTSTSSSGLPVVSPGPCEAPTQPALGSTSDHQSLCPAALVCVSKPWLPEATMSRMSADRSTHDWTQPRKGMAGPGAETPGAPVSHVGQPRRPRGVGNRGCREEGPALPGASVLGSETGIEGPAPEPKGLRGPTMCPPILKSLLPPCLYSHHPSVWSSPSPSKAPSPSRVSFRASSARGPPHSLGWDRKRPFSSWGALSYLSHLLVATGFKCSSTGDCGLTEGRVCGFSISGTLPLGPGIQQLLNQHL